MFLVLLLMIDVSVTFPPPYLCLFEAESRDTNMASPYKAVEFILSSISFMGKIEPKKMTCLSMCGFIVRLVEHRTGIRGGHGFKSR